MIFHTHINFFFVHEINKISSHTENVPTFSTTKNCLRARLHCLAFYIGWPKKEKVTNTHTIEDLIICRKYLRIDQCLIWNTHNGRNGLAQSSRRLFAAAVVIWRKITSVGLERLLKHLLAIGKICKIAR